MPWPTELRGMVNVYVCKKCKTFYPIILLDDGITTFLIACKRKDCDGECHSTMYSFDWIWPKLTIDHAFFRPTMKWIRRQQKDHQHSIIQHCRGGGLIHADLIEAMENRNSLNFDGMSNDESTKFLAEHYRIK